MEELMGIFTRFMDIINSNINALLDKAEDPEKMIRLMMQEMEDTLVDLKSSCAAKIASRSRTLREQDTFQQKVNRWAERAQLAVEKGRDDLAREALIEKKDAQARLDEINSEVEHFNQIINECKNNILQIEEKLQIVIQKHKVLIRRGNEAREKSRINKVMKDAAGSGVLTRFEDLENRIERMESDAEVSGFGSSTSLESEFSKLEAGDDVDNELAELKKSAEKTKS
jgi:phage shock protein A